jgi:hypothetical protein
MKWRLKATRSGRYSIFQLAPLIHRTDATDTTLWPSPNKGTENANRANKGQDPAKRKADGSQVELRDLVPVSAWPTPAGRDQKGANGQAHFDSRERPHLDQLPNALKATWPTPNQSDGSGGPQHPHKRKAGNHSTQLPDYTPNGTTTSGCLARTERFVERLMTLSAWLMGYTAAYLAHWETAKSRKSPTKSSRPSKLH